MTSKEGITYFVGTIFLMLLTLGCKEKEVTVTKAYVINPYWDKIDNSFTVTKMLLKDSTDSINLKNISPSELLRKLVEDTNLSFIANVKYNGEDYPERKVYFNRANGFSWRKLNDKNSNYKQEIFGELQQKIWYSLGGLGEEKTLYYIYLDNLDNLHSFKVPASSWTNY